MFKPFTYFKKVQLITEKNNSRLNSTLHQIYH